MLNTFNLDSGNRGALNRRKQSSPERIANGGTETALEGLGGKAAVPFGKCFSVRRQATRHLKSGPEIILIHSHSVLSPDFGKSCYPRNCK